MHWFFAHLSAVLELGTYFAVVPVHISHKVCIIRWSQPSYAASVTQLCLHWCSAQLSAVLTLSPHWSQGLCVEADEAVFGEIWSASCFHINWWCLMSTLTCACIGVMHIWALYRNWAHMLLRFLCTSVTWSWAAQRIPSSADDVFWAESLSHQSPYAASVTNLCLHWCSAHLFSALCSSPHRSQGLCVESDEAVLGEIWSASYFTINWWCLISILTCACIGFMHIWLLYWSWAHMLLWFQCASVTRSVSSDLAVIHDLGCAAYSSSTDVVFWPSCLSQQPPYAASFTTSST